MPYLPLNSPEPFSATLGVMFYPGTGDADRRKARAFAAQYLAGPIQQASQEGFELDYELLLTVATSKGERLLDLEDRLYWGSAVGQMFKSFFAMANTDPSLASWHRSAALAKRQTEGSHKKGSRRSLERAIGEFAPVVHLWGAWAIRNGQFSPRPEVGYDYLDDFFSFIAEAEILRQQAEQWPGTRKDARPPLPKDPWRAPPDWQPPARQDGWPDTGRIPVLEIPPDVLSTLKPTGRPRKTRKKIM